MATRPTPGGSDGTWGTELNAHLDISLDADGKVDDGAAQTTSAAPSADAELANKKYTDDSIPTSGFWTTDGTTVFNTTLTAAGTFQDLDISAQVGSNDAICFFEVTIVGGGTGATFVMKPKGEGGTVAQHIAVWGAASITLTGGYFGYIWCPTDSSGVVQIGGAFNTNANTIKLIGYIK